MIRYQSFVTLRPRCLVFGLLLAGAIAIGPAQGSVIHFRADGQAQERKYLHADNSRVILIPEWRKRVRNLDGNDAFVIWRFDATGAKAARLSILMQNAYVLSASADGDNFTELDRYEESAGGGWKEFELNQFLPTRWLYLQIAHGAPRKYDGDYGACISEVKLELDDDERHIAVGQAAATSKPITIDGQLAEPVWAKAQPLATLSHRYMTQSPGRHTVFWLTYDEGHLYVAVECELPGADTAFVGTQHRDDFVWTDDTVEVFVMPPGQAHYYQFVVNLAGNLADAQSPEPPRSWDGDVEIATQRTATGWTLELAIPAPTLNAAAPLAAGQLWRVGLMRNVAELTQGLTWSSVLGGGWHSPDRFGYVTLVPETTQPPPAVNLALDMPEGQGEHPVTVQLSGLVTAQDYELSLDLIPIVSPVLDDSQQELRQMNPGFADVPLSDDAAVATEAHVTIDRFGTAQIVATLREKQTGLIVSRSVQSVTLTPEVARPLAVTPRQPFVSTEQSIPVEIGVNLSEDRMPGPQVRVTVFTEGRESLYVSEAVAAQRKMTLALPVQALPVGKYITRYEILGASGERLALVEKPLEKFAPEGTPRHRRIEEDGVLYVDGRAMLPYGYHLSHPSNPGVEELGNLAFHWGEAAPHPEHVYDTALNKGIFYIPHLCNFLRRSQGEPYDLDGLRAVVSRYKNHPGLLAWYLADEFEHYQDTQEDLRMAYQIIKSIDPDTPVIVLTVSPGLLGYLDGCADVIVSDPYPIPGHPLTMVADWTDATVRAAERNGQAPWMTLQAFGADISWPGEPSLEAQTNMLYTAFIHGAKGILWFFGIDVNHYFRPHHIKLRKQVQFMEPWILGGKPVEGWPAGVQVNENVHWRAWQHQGKILVLAANLSETRSQHLRLPRPVVVSKWFSMTSRSIGRLCTIGSCPT